MLAVCGASAASLPETRLPETRIVGGSAARENEFPYAVSIQQLSQVLQNTRGHICGGVLITLRHVLTTASCTYSYANTGSSPVPIIPSEYRVFAGSVLLTNNSSPELFRMVVNITRHPNYIGSPMFVNDIAIITLNEPFNNAVVTPLPLPHQSFQPAEGAECVTAGWGSQEITVSANVNMLFARKVIPSQKICAIQYNTVQGPNILPSMLCATTLDGRTAGCVGDYGNGLVCNGGLAGILSMSSYCTVNTFPEVYTRVANYTTWIRNVTGGASTFQPGLAALILFTVVQLITAKIIS